MNAGFSMRWKLSPVRSGIGALTLVCALLPALPVQAQFTMAIPGNEPFTGAKDGKPAGLIAEATADVLKAMGREVNLRNLPFKRMYKWVHEGKVDVAISVLKTPDRAKLALYTDPVITEYTVIMVPAGKVFKLNKVADLKYRRIGGQLGFRYPPLDGVGVKLIRERNYQTNIAKIASGKIEGILIGSVTGQYLVKNLGYTGQVEILPKAIGSVGFEQSQILGRRPGGLQ